jgi:hypothetical protein
LHNLLFKEKYEREVQDMKDVLNNVKHELQDYNTVKQQAKYQAQRIQELEQKVKKSSGLHMDESSLTPQRMQQLLSNALNRNMLYDQSKDDDKLLLAKSVDYLESLQRHIYNDDDTTTVFKALLEQLSHHIDLRQDHTQAEDAGEDINTEVGYFVSITEFSFLFLSVYVPDAACSPGRDN